ncbi:MAG: DUF2282 domain-containing protein [Chitinophagia bacterium]|nr:DUF2282 domain-containing protein [Chitinophagia bacterium]
MRKQLMAAAILSALMVGGIAHATDATEKKEEREKCYGIAKAEKNDCASKDGSNSCAGSMKKDGGWIYLPKGICDKIVNGTKS